MSSFAGPNVVDDGLVLSLDAGNLKGILRDVEVLVVAGGGGSGGGGNTGYHGGGGGGGGVVYSKFRSITSGSAIDVTVGNGGSAGTQSSDSGFRGGTGGNSSFGSLISNGGGGGGGNAESGGANGGSGGGGNLYSGAGGSTNQPTYIDALVFGNNGGSGQSDYGSAGGGGGARTAGTSGVANIGGQGGQGILNNITGSAVFYGGGGGGAGNTLNATSINGSTAAYVAGSPNTGQGGGGRQSTSGLSGGSGIVIVRYPGSQRATGGTITSFGGHTIHTFTTSGTFTPTWGDITGRGNNGTLVNGPTFSSGNGGSMVFDGVNDYVTTNYIPIFSGDFCINFWVKFNTYISYQNPVSSANDGNATQGFWMEFGTGRGFTLYNTGGVLALEDNVINLTTLGTNVWYNMCVSRVGIGSNNLKLYVNNALCGQNTYTGTIGHASQVLELSRYSKNATNLFLNGSISNLQIYNNKGLSAAEITLNFNATRSRYGI